MNPSLAGERVHGAELLSRSRVCRRRRGWSRVAGFGVLRLEQLDVGSREPAGLTFLPLLLNESETLPPHFTARFV